LVTVEISIEPSLEQKLGQNWSQIQEEISTKLVEECLKNMKIEVPVDTGRLHDSLKTGSDGLNKTITSDTSYWMYVNYGTSRQSPNPYIQRATDDVKKEINSIISEVLKSKGL